MFLQLKLCFHRFCFLFCHSFCLCASPCYNPTGWLGIKHQFTYTYCLCAYFLVLFSFVFSHFCAFQCLLLWLCEQQFQRLLTDISAGRLWVCWPCSILVLALPWSCWGVLVTLMVTLMVTVVMVMIALSSALHFTELVWHCLLWRDSRSKYRRLLSFCVQICKLLSSRHVYCLFLFF